jgi:ribosomal protein S18 acetylase RimI-like enzyme
MALPDDIELVKLTKALASAHAERIADLLNRIPLLTYTTDDVLAEVSHRGKALVGKWDQSIAVIRSDEVVAVLIAHQKKADPPWYPVDSCYLSEIAVDSSAEGLGLARLMTESWLRDTQHLAPHSLQTNSSESNAAVRHL